MKNNCPSTYNSIIYSITSLLKANNTAWNDVLPMTLQAPFEFTESNSAVATLKKKLSLNDYATAQNCFDEMVKRYSLEKYHDDEKRIIMGVRYSMERADFSVSNPYTVVEDITPELMITVAETYTGMPGVPGGGNLHFLRKCLH